MDDAVVLLSLQEIQQGRSAVLIGEGDGLADPGRAFEILRLIWPEQRQIAVERRVRGIDIAEHLRFGRRPKPFVAADIQLGALLLSLIPIEDAEGDVNANADRIDSV